MCSMYTEAKVLFVILLHIIDIHIQADIHIVRSNFSLLTSESMIDTRQQSIINVALCGLGLIVCVQY